MSDHISRISGGYYVARVDNSWKRKRASSADRKDEMKKLVSNERFQTRQHDAQNAQIVWQ